MQSEAFRRTFIDFSLRLNVLKTRTDSEIKRKILSLQAEIEPLYKKLFIANHIYKSFMLQFATPAEDMRIPKEFNDIRLINSEDNEGLRISTTNIVYLKSITPIYLGNYLISLWFNKLAGVIIHGTYPYENIKDAILFANNAFFINYSYMGFADFAHPHIVQRYGYACFGDLINKIVNPLLLQEFNLELLFNLILAYLYNITLEDPVSKISCMFPKIIFDIDSNTPCLLVSPYIQIVHNFELTLPSGIVVPKVSINRLVQEGFSEETLPLNPFESVKEIAVLKDKVRIYSGDAIRIDSMILEERANMEAISLEDLNPELDIISIDDLEEDDDYEADEDEFEETSDQSEELSNYEEDTKGEK